MIHPSGIETSDYKIYEPNELQIANAARIKEAYPARKVKRKSFWWIQFAYALMVLFILLASVGALIIIAEFLRTFSGD